MVLSKHDDVVLLHTYMHALYTMPTSPVACEYKVNELH